MLTVGARIWGVKQFSWLRAPPRFCRTSLLRNHGHSILAGCGKKAAWHVILSTAKGSALFVFNKIQQMLRFAQHDKFRFSQPARLGWWTFHKKTVFAYMSLSPRTLSGSQELRNG